MPVSVNDVHSGHRFLSGLFHGQSKNKMVSHPLHGSEFYKLWVSLGIGPTCLPVRS